jgi:hypothetical protein
MSKRLPAVLRFSWQQAAVLAVAVGAAAALQTWAHWGTLPVLGMVVAVTIAGRAVTDMWPRKIPAELSGEMEKLRADGWRPLRYHPFLCTEKNPHMHVTKGGGTPVQVTLEDRSAAGR